MTDRQQPPPPLSTFEIILIVSAIGSVLVLAAHVGISFGAQLGHLFG